MLYQKFKNLVKNQLRIQGLYLSRNPILSCLKSEKIVSYISEEDIPKSIINNIFNFYHKVPIFYDDKIQEPLQIKGAWKGILSDQRKNQIKYIQSNDKQGFAQLLKKLFFNELSRGLWNYHYYSPTIEGTLVNRNFIEEALIYEKISSRNASFLASDKSWSHWGVMTDAGIIKYPSINHGIQAFNIQNLIQTFDAKISVKPIKILDLGSGWGGMAEQLLKSEINNPFSLLLLDIPLNLTLAYAYLSRIFGLDKIHLISSVDDLESITFEDRHVYLVPSLFTKEISNFATFDIVNNFQSFSEMDTSTIQFYLENFLTSAKFFIENNVNIDAHTYNGGFSEILVRDFPIPLRYRLLSRFSASESWSRYVTSIYTLI